MEVTENLDIEVSYTSGRDLQLSLKSQKNEENTTHVFYKINYINFLIEFPHIRRVITQRNAFQQVALNLILLPCQLTSFNWHRSMIKLKGTSQRCIPSSQKRMHSKRLLWIESYCPAEYMLCSLNLLTFQRGLQISTFSIRHFNTNIFSKLTRIKLKFQQNKDTT